MKCLSVLLVLTFALASDAFGQWASNGGHISNTNVGNVGIGTTNPTADLDVDGEGNFSGRLSGQFSLSLGTQGGGQQFVVGFQNELANWKQRGGTLLTSASSGVTIAQPYLVTEPQCSASCSAAITFSSPGTATFEFTDLGTFPAMGTRSWGVYLQMRQGQVPASITVELLDQSNVWNVLVTDSSPVLRAGLWYSGQFSKPLGDTDPKGIRFTLAYSGTGASYVRALGLFHQNRAFGTYTLPYLHSENTFSGRNFFNDRVGIGTSAPTEKLHVDGNVIVSGTLTGGNIQAKYQDIAEWVDSTEALAPGSVVALDQLHANQVVASRRAYDTSVAGVVSPQPGLILGESSGGDAMIATFGRVRVKVDATVAPISIGDLLVTSDKTGVAMKSEPVDIGGVPFHRPGTIIGKALEPLTEGEGEILVLLSLQ